MEPNLFRYDPHSKNAIGKRKVESEGSALLLQDVFSDSANLAGMQQKTSCLPETGQGKWVATPKKEMKKTPKIHELVNICININQ